MIRDAKPNKYVLEEVKLCDPCHAPCFFKFWDPALHNFSTDEAIDTLFFLCWIGHDKYYIRDDEWPQRGRGQGHVSYF